MQDVVNLVVILMPIAGIILLLVGATTRQFKFVTIGIACIGTTICYLGIQGRLNLDFDSIFNTAWPLYVKIGVGVVTSVIAGILIKYFLNR